ncbi:TonB-dependent receptor [Bowmanella yangjiangensis]|uniref:TonB-dependent receptor n=1 Tax=Bowmanella yangjiangensis TaxID=2811230 RepID=A0ABS3CRV9_9ALTE|nr:TonB-dependent receptor [Bowmanella yangjiangensis]MBN7819852.1 TonB-dependent receptor [Bowmanella yangjiangensis]
MKAIPAPVKHSLCHLAVVSALTLGVVSVSFAQSEATTLTGLPLGQALNSLSQQLGLVIIAPTRLVRDKTAATADSTLPPLEQVRQMLKGSGLQVQQNHNGTLVIKAGQTNAQVTNEQQVSSTKSMDEIVVTAMKRESTLQDVPVALSVLGQQAIRDKGISDFTDLVDSLAGVSINSAFGGPENSFITIRGIGGADDYKPNGNPSVALHVDGIYQTSNAYLSMPLFDLERIEVVKGPQGTLYGRNTTAGAINAITRGATDSLEGYAELEYGSYDHISGTFAVGGPLSDKLGARVAVTMRQGGGFMDGEGAGSFAGYVPEGFEGIIPPVSDPGKREGFGDADLFAMRGTLQYAFSPLTELTLRYFMSANNGDTRQYDRIAFSDDKPALNAGEDSDPYRFYASEYYSHQIDVSGFNGEFSHQLPNQMSLDVLAGYQKSERNVSGNGDGTPFPKFRYDFDEELEQSSLEVRLSDVSGGEVDWLVGAFIVSDSVDFISDWTSYAVMSQYSSPYNQRRNSSALFGNLDWYLTDDLSINAGLRYTSDQVKFRGSNIDHNPWGVSVYEDYFKSPSNFSWDKEFTDNNLSGKLSATYYVSDRLNVFASVGTAYRGGGFDGTSIFTLEETEPFDSEEVLAYEAGLRYVHEEGLNLSLDLFSYEFEELQATARLANDTNGRTNVGKAEVKGGEAALSLPVWHGDNQSFSLDAAVTYLDSEITEFHSNRVNDVQNTLGDPLPGSPRWSGNAAFEYLHLLSDSQLRARLEYSFHDEESNRLNAGEGNLTPAYSLLGLRLELAMNNGMTLYAYGRNILDKEYFLELNAGARLVGEPATYGAGINYSF